MGCSPRQSEALFFPRGTYRGRMSDSDPWVRRKKAGARLIWYGLVTTHLSSYLFLIYVANSDIVWIDPKAMSGFLITALGSFLGLLGWCAVFVFMFPAMVRITMAVLAISLTVFILTACMPRIT